MNQVVISGNLGGDPDFKQSKSGTDVATFQMAFKSSKDKTNWLKVVCYNKIAQIAESNLHKGAKVVVSGMLDYNEFVTNRDEDKSQFQVIANSIEFLKQKKKTDKSKDKDDNLPF